MTPRATYRVQFSRSFTLSDAARIVPYLSRLGISHLYASPLLAARPGSKHCYDIVDHRRINPELGGEAGLRALVAVLRAHDMGLLLDIVPNHMGVGGADNAYWLDVLQWGRASPYATWFDIDWSPADPRLRDRVLVPFLGAPYGVALDEGTIRLEVEHDTGRLAARYHDHVFPIAPRDYAAVLGPAGSATRELAKLLAPQESGTATWSLRLAPRSRSAFESACRSLAAALRESATARAAVDAALARFNAESLAGRDALHDLLERQHYRLAWWRAAADEVNYRRFFDINELAGFRVEVPAAFDEAHALILELWRDGLIDGVRIDHVDGLADPRGYCRKLRRRMQSLAASRPAGLSRHPWILVEKILARHELLPPGWQVDGTTGYDFMDAIGAVLHDPAGEAPLSALLNEIAERPVDLHAEEVAARRQILRDHLGAELAAVAMIVHRILQRDRATRDFTLTGVRRALHEIVVHFPAYRTYCDRTGPTDEDHRILDWAIAAAAKAMRATDRPLLDELKAILCGQRVRQSPPGPQRHDALLAVRRFQQLTGPTAAKAVEDTTFYRYVRLLSRNEVGSDPGRFALRPAAFVRMQRRRQRMPLALLATATHDHKRGEDARTRLAVLSEMPDLWASTVRRWMRLNAPFKAVVDGVVSPTQRDEYQLYQTIVGAIDPSLDKADAGSLLAFRERVEGWFLKALREAKLHTDWSVANEPYEQAALGFLRAAFDAGRSTPFVKEVLDFAALIAPRGAALSLAQATVKCLSIGIPDVYQGTERADFSLVDPDNRRPVDFEDLAASLGDAKSRATAPGYWDDRRAKQQVMGRLLGLRRDHPEMFRCGRYLPVRTTGVLADAFLGQLLAYQHAALLLVVPRATGWMCGSTSEASERTHELSRTFIVLPAKLEGMRATSVLTEGQAPLLRRMPLSTLMSVDRPMPAVLFAAP